MLACVHARAEDPKVWVRVEDWLGLAGERCHCLTGVLAGNAVRSPWILVTWKGRAGGVSQWISCGEEERETLYAVSLLILRPAHPGSFLASKQPGMLHLGAFAGTHLS